MCDKHTTKHVCFSGLYKIVHIAQLTKHTNDTTNWFSWSIISNCTHK